MELPVLGSLRHCGQELIVNRSTQREIREVLDDYRCSITAIYAPTAYLQRALHVAKHLDQWPPHAPQSAESPNSSMRLLGLGPADWRQLLRLTRRAARAGPLTLFYVLIAMAWAVRRKPAVLYAVATFAAFYVHLGPFARDVSRAVTRQINDIDNGRWHKPKTERMDRNLA